MKTFTLRLPDDLHKQLKMKCVENGISMQEMITLFIEFAFANTDIFDELSDEAKHFKLQYLMLMKEYMDAKRAKGTPEQ